MLIKKKYKIVLGVQYNGFNYYGWQQQPKVITIQKVLTNVLSKIANHPILLKCAGRTDKQVHAIEQIIHFTTTTYRTNFIWVKATNHMLPKDIFILWATKVSFSFHATFSSKARQYVYIINNNKYSTFFNKLTYYYPKKLNINKMKIASNYLIGKHDFSTFRSAHCQASNPIRNIYYISINSYQSLIFITFIANGFLYHMIRNIVGNLLVIGSNITKSVNWMLYLLSSKNRQLSAPPAKAYGLYLEKIYYDKQYNLPNHNIINNHINQFIF